MQYGTNCAVRPESINLSVRGRFMDPGRLVYGPDSINPSVRGRIVDPYGPLRKSTPPRPSNQENEMTHLFAFCSFVVLRWLVLPHSLASSLFLGPARFVDRTPHTYLSEIRLRRLDFHKRGCAYEFIH